MKRYKSVDGDTSKSGVLSSANSTILNLSAAQSFTGLYENVEDFSSVSVLVFINTAGGEAGTLSLTLSPDTTSTRTKSFLINSGNSSVHTLSIVSKYFRVSLSADQGTSCTGTIQTIYHYYRQAGLISYIGETLTDYNDATITRAVITAQDTSGTFQNVKADLKGALKISNGITGIYGEAIGIQYTPYVQTSHFYGIATQSQQHILYTNNGSATASANGDSVELAITTDVNAYVVLRDRRVIKYRHGYGNIVRVGCTFDTPVVGSLQFCGVGSAICDLYFAYSGTTFGVRRSTGGRLQIYALTVTAAATGGTITITLNNTAFIITLSNAGGSIPFTAHEIEIGGTTGESYTSWTTEHVGDTVYFIAGAVGARGDINDYGVTLDTEAALTTTEAMTATGAALNTTFVSQASWNGPSPMVTSLDPTKANLYEIQYTWFGTANIEFKVYNPDTAIFENVHTMTFANSGTDYSLTQANMYIQRGLYSITSTTALTMTSSGSFGATLGTFDLNKSPKATASRSTYSLPAATEEVVLTLQCARQLNGFTTNSEVLLREITIATDGNRPVLIKVIRNPDTLSANTTSDYTSLIYFSETDNLLTYDIVTKTYTGGRIIRQFIVPKNGGSTIDLRSDDLFMASGDKIIITAFSTAVNTVDVSVVTISDN